MPRCVLGMNSSRKDPSYPRMHLMHSRECVTRPRRRDAMQCDAMRSNATHCHRFLLAPRCACKSISGVLSEADVEGSDSCDISIRGCPKGRVPEVDPPLPRPDQSNFNNDFTAIVRRSLFQWGQFVFDSLSTRFLS